MTEADLQRAQLDLDNLKTDLEQAFFDLLLGFSDYDAFTRMVAKG